MPDNSGNVAAEPERRVSSTLRVSDHASKIRMAFLGFIVANPRKNIEPAIAPMLALQHGRGPAMYTGIGQDSEIFLPATAVQERPARDCVASRATVLHLPLTIWPTWPTDSIGGG